MISEIEKKCIEKGITMTGPRRAIARALENSKDHPDVEEIFARAKKIDKKVSIATVYRTLKLFEGAGVITTLNFGDGRMRFEALSNEHHDHIIDIRADKVIEFSSDEIERIQETIARDHGYRVVDHKMELYVVPIDDE